MDRRAFLTGAAALGFGGAALEPASAQSFPTNVIRIVVPTSASTPPDILARIVATELSEAQGWKVEVLAASPGEHGGYREIVSRIVGRGAYSRLKFESGTHRVQRVPATEAQGRIHTSTCTVAILPELEAVEELPLNPAELRIDTYRASGAGGQHVNKTDSAVRITHIPTNTVVQCQNERSQHKNKDQAFKMLRARLYELEMLKRQEAQQALEDGFWAILNSREFVFNH